MDKPIFAMLMGLVASGKSTKAKELAEEYDATIFSSDALRAELYGDVNDQTHNQELFVELHRRIKDCLRSGKSVIYDATNLYYKRRMSFLHELKNISCKKICVLMATPYEECLLRNSKRDRKVPEHVIERMYKSIDVPWYYEGWDRICVVYSNNSYGLLGFDRDWAESMKNFDQENPHHELSLGDHCIQTRRHVNKIQNEIGEPTGNELRHAALIHDNGKCFTKAFHNGKGEPTDIAHYFNHERVGSYNSLFFEMSCSELYVAVLVKWHMQPYFWERDNNEKLHNKYRKLWGEDLYQDIMILHEADRLAH